MGAEPLVLTNEEEAGTIITFTGRRFNLARPCAADIEIRDIAHALALQCRFAGHTRVRYSVAEHSVRVSREVPRNLALWGLLHDASEAYLVDVPRPLKRMAGMAFYREMEARVMAAVVERFGLTPAAEPAAVKVADQVLLRTEQRDLVHETVRESRAWQTSRRLGEVIEPWNWYEAEARFLARYEDLTGARW